MSRMRYNVVRACATTSIAHAPVTWSHPHYAGRACDNLDLACDNLDLACASHFIAHAHVLIAHAHLPVSACVIVFAHARFGVTHALQAGSRMRYQLDSACACIIVASALF